MEDGGYGGGSTAKHDKSNLKLISFFFFLEGTNLLTMHDRMP